MTKVLCSACILICVLVTSVKCQESDDDQASSWNRFWEIFKRFYDKMSNAVKNAWRDFTEEIKAGAKDFRGWTREVWDSFKQSMTRWIDERPDIDSYEKEEMRKYLERLEEERED